MSASTLRRLAELQLAPEQMAGVLGILAELAEVEEEARAKETERKRRDRDRKATGKFRGNSTESDGNSAEIPAEIQADPSAPSLSPQTPQTHPHLPGDITTREGGFAKASTLRLAKPNGFARFWDAYPNKTGKLAAEKAFAKAIDKIADADPLAVMLAGIERSRSSREWREGYIPHPTTWLNRGGWDDQPAEIIQLQPQGRPNERPNPDPRQSARNDRLGRSLAGLMAAVDERTAGLD